MSADTCLDGPTILGFLALAVLVAAVLCVFCAPLWLPTLIEYFSPLARAVRQQEREINRRAAELVLLGVPVADAIERARPPLPTGGETR